MKSVKKLKVEQIGSSDQAHVVKDKINLMVAIHEGNEKYCMSESCDDKKEKKV